jgi:hypothetical protein
VRGLGERLEQAGLKVVLDQFAQERGFHGGGPNEGWPRWSKKQADDPAHKVLIIASPGWFRCYEGKELAGIGLGASAETGVIEQRLYNTAGINADIRIVTFEPLAPTDVPTDLQRYQRFGDPEEFADLVRWLSGAAPAAGPTDVLAEWPVAAPDLDWPVADHTDVRTAFRTLIQRGAPWRFLPLRGPSEAGKSHLTRQMLANALSRLPGLACGRFDFKGTTDVQAELRAFVQFLQVPLPSPDLRLNEGLGRLLDALRARAKPALLIFDTYEAAGEAQDWVDKQLLPNLIPSPWLRVVIAGQRVPERAGAVWAAAASPTVQLEPPPPEDWFEYGQPHKPGLTLDFVRQAHGFCQGKAGLLAQLLGPTT